MATKISAPYTVLTPPVILPFNGRVLGREIVSGHAALVAVNSAGFISPLNHIIKTNEIV
jgi:hypothetical protein